MRPGQKVLDIGCGWGGMAFEIARQSQCEVTGISLSENQINYCKQKAKELFTKSAAIYEKVHGSTHSETVDARKKASLCE